MKKKILSIKLTGHRWFLQGFLLGRFKWKGFMAQFHIFLGIGWVNFFLF